MMTWKWWFFSWEGHIKGRAFLSLSLKTLWSHFSLDCSLSLLLLLLLFSHQVMTLCNPMDCTCQATLSMGFPRQEHWSGLPLPCLGDLPDPGIKSVSCTGSGFFTTEPPGKPLTFWKLFSPSSLFLPCDINEVKISSSSLLPCGTAKDQAPCGHRFENSVENLS